MYMYMYNYAAARVPGRLKYCSSPNDLIVFDNIIIIVLLHAPVVHLISFT